MKLVCSVAVHNRLLPSLALKSKSKHVKSTLALCKIPKSDEYCIILFTTQNKNGTKYPINGNISTIITKFISEGKATIQFKAPPHDFFINSDQIQLKGFLHLLKRVLENKILEKELTCSSLAVTGVSSKDMAPKKLVITSRADYPLRGLPRTLEYLYINNINRCSLDKGILFLSRLKILDLTQNLIEFLPTELNRLPNLTELHLGSNQFHKSTLKQWSWMGGNLSRTLLLLNLESNNLEYLPDQIVKLYNLATLNIGNNLLKALPTGIGNLRFLNTLIAYKNQLSVLPGSIKKCNFKIIDLCNNQFRQVRPNDNNKIPKSLPISLLKDISAQAVLWQKIPYTSSSIPYTLVDYLDHAKYCVCGRACFNVFIRVPEMFLISKIAQSFIVSAHEVQFLPIDCYFCTIKCYRASSIARNRNPVI